MKKLLALFALCSIGFIPAPAVAIQGYYYGKVQGGMNFFEGKTVNSENFLMGPIAGIAVGYDFTNVMLEVEMSMRRNSTKNPNYDSVTGEELGGDRVQTYCWMGNLYYERDFCWIVTPYIGGGIGYEQIDRGPLNKTGASHKTLRNGFAYQGMVGFYYDLCDDLSSIGVEYRYHRYRGDHYYSNSVIFSFRQWL